MVCAEAEDANQALEVIEEQPVDLAVVDISLECTNGLELTERKKMSYPNLVVPILSKHDGLLYAQRAPRAGASGYVAMHEAAEKIIATIRLVLSGKIYISDSKALRMMSDAAFNSSDRLDLRKGLSPNTE